MFPCCHSFNHLLYINLSILYVAMLVSGLFLIGLAHDPRIKVPTKEQRLHRERSSIEFGIYAIIVGVFSIWTFFLAAGEACTLEGTNCHPVYASLQVKVLFVAFTIILWVGVREWPRITRIAKSMCRLRFRDNR